MRNISHKQCSSESLAMIETVERLKDQMCVSESLPGTNEECVSLDSEYFPNFYRTSPCPIGSKESTCFDDIPARLITNMLRYFQRRVQNPNLGKCSYNLWQPAGLILRRHRIHPIHESAEIKKIHHSRDQKNQSPGAVRRRRKSLHSVAFLRSSVSRLRSLPM